MRLAFNLPGIFHVALFWWPLEFIDMHLRKTKRKLLLYCLLFVNYVRYA